MNTKIQQMPRHIAIIMDGNGRWAEERKRVRWEGHAEGARAVRRTVESCARLGVEYLTLYAFSVNNWQRPRLEVEALMRLLRRFAKKEESELMKQNIRVRVVGNIDALPKRTRAALDRLLENTAGCTGMTLNLALSYGGRDDIAQASRRLAEKLKAGLIEPSDFTPEALQAELSTGHCPDVDLLIRTGGESRVSDFLLFESAYAELCFLAVRWPDFCEEHLLSALRSFGVAERRFGLTSAQTSGSHSLQEKALETA